MGRTALQPSSEAHIVEESTASLNMADAVAFYDQVKHEASENALAVARQVGYDGTLTVGALEDEIRFYQQRTVEACIELGKRLIVLKELTPHGEFKERVKLLGVEYTTATRFMAATLKFSKVGSNQLLKAAGTQTKMLELLVLDDGEVEALESGETVRGITLDKIETLSVSELKKALRDANATAEAKDKVIKDKTGVIDQQAERIALLESKHANEPVVSLEQALLNARSSLQIAAADIKANVMVRLRKQVKQLVEETVGDNRTFAAAALIEIMQELEILRDEFDLPARIDVDQTPEWLKGSEYDARLPTVSDVLVED